MAVVAIPQDVAARLQLAMIAGNAPPEHFLELRIFRNGPKGSEWFSVRDFAAAADRAIALGPTHDVYVGAAPRVRQRGRAEDVESCCCLWADCDSAESVERLREFQPAPTIVNRSGGPGRFHAWWALREPVTPAQAVRANRRLARVLGADRATTDAPRIMRVAGTFNHKGAKPVAVGCGRCELDTFTLSEIVHGLPDDPAYIPRRAPAPRESAGPAALAGLVRVVRDAPVGERNRRLNWASYRAGEHGFDPAEVERELLAAALDAGLPEPEALRTIASGLRAHEARAA